VKEKLVGDSGLGFKQAEIGGGLMINEERSQGRLGSDLKAKGGSSHQLNRGLSTEER